MSKLHIADKRTAEWVRKYPSAIEQAETFSADRAEFGESWPEWCGLPMAAVYAIITRGADLLTAERILSEHPGDLARLTAALLWRQAKAIYRFDKALAAELDAADDMDMDVPSEVLKRLPYWCIYIDYPFFVSPGVNALGAFVWLEADRRAPRTVELRILYLLANDNVISVPLKLSGRTFADGLSLIPPVEKAERRMVLDAVRLTVSMALYVCSDAADIATRIAEPAPLGSKPRTFKASPSAPTVWEAGMRIGAAIKAYRADQRATASDGSHASPRPHMRRAHWHHFWTGPRAGERMLVLRWLPPVPVNYDVGAELPSVVFDIAQKRKED